MEPTVGGERGGEALINVVSVDAIVKRCEAAHAWVVSSAIEMSIYYYLLLIIIIISNRYAVTTRMISTSRWAAM